jgi:hypothetical protein
VVATSSLVLWQVLTDAYRRLGFDQLADEAFRAMVLARIIEPTSKTDSLRVLAEIGAPCPSVRTLYRSLKRCQAGDYRDTLAKACAARSSAAGGLSAMVMYDCTTLHFEISDEDTELKPGAKPLRKVGMSKEHRVDPQVQVGLLVDPSGFPLEVHLFEGNTAETTTLLPVLKKFQERHGVTGLVVVADAGMLSANNLNEIEDAGFCFIVGSRITKAPYDLADHFARHGDYFADGQILESSRAMGSGKHKRTRRVVYQWSFKRSKRDEKAINAQIARAEKIAEGRAPLARTRFLKVTDATRTRPGHHRPRPSAGRAERLRVQSRSQGDGRRRRHRGLPRLVASRGLVPDDEVRPAGPTRVPPREGRDRSTSDRRVRCPGHQPRPADPHRGDDQEARPDSAHRTLGHHRGQRPAPDP